MAEEWLERSHQRLFECKLSAEMDQKVPKNMPPLKTKQSSQADLRKTASLSGVVLVFVVSFLWFFSTRWYAPADLYIKGAAPEGDGIVNVTWDNGAGFNDYEARRFVLHKYREDGGLHRVSIRFTGKKNGASMSPEVVCEKIIVDGKRLNLAALITNGEKGQEGKSIRLSHAGQQITFDIAADESVLIEMATNNNSGIAEILFDEHSSYEDLYVANIEAKSRIFQYWLAKQDTSFNLRMAMPRYKIKTLLLANGHPSKPLMLEEVKIADDRGERLLHGGASLGLDKIGFSRVSETQYRYFHPSRFLQQLVFAALTTWIVTACFRLIRRCRDTGGLFCGQRKIFWLMWVSGVAVFSFWLLAFWPGVMSVDSLKIWRAALLPEIVINDHPLLNVVLYRYLSGLWNNIAGVVIFHIVIVAGLLAFVFYRMVRHGLGLWVAVPFFALAVLSLPVGLYNIVLWKDIPFAVLIVFWGWIVEEEYLGKSQRRPPISFEMKFALLLLLFALAFTRHNGLIYLIIVPLALMIFLSSPNKEVIQRRAIFGFLLAVVCAGIALWFLQDLGNYTVTQAWHYIGSKLDDSPGDTLARMWENYWGIFDVTQTKRGWDLWHYFLQDRFAYGFLQHVGYSDAFGYVKPGNILPGLTNFAMWLYHRSYEVPWVYFTWNHLHGLVLYLVAVLFCFRLPATAIFSGFVLAQVLTLLFIDVMNWRYYYFAYLGGFLLIPLIVLDCQRRQRVRKGLAKNS